MSNHLSYARDLPLSPVGRSGWPWDVECGLFDTCRPDSSPWPKISVVTPSYNQGQFIEETIRSVLLQDYPNLEYIVVDGGSKDNTLEIIKKYESWLAYWVSEPDRGQSHALNKGIRKATGDILLWLNSDDICLPNVFHQVAIMFRTNPAIRLLIGQARLIDFRGDVIGELRSQFLSWEEVVTNPRNSIRQISTFFSRKLFDELGLLDESLHIAMDTDLLVRFTRSHTPLVLTDFLTAYRTHVDAKTYRQLIRGYAESDRLRGKYLPNQKAKSIYRRRSSANWTSLSELSSLSQKERALCLIHAIQNRPAIIFSRDFLNSLKKLCFANNAPKDINEASKT